jgi:hypothetical protein
LARLAKSIVENVSGACCSAGDTFAMIIVFELPPSESWRKQVSQ